jgi:uncharacterized membrane protein
MILPAAVASAVVNARTSDLLAYALLAGSAALGLLVWPALPETVAIHFGLGGDPDTFVSKPVGVVLTPAIGVLAVLAVRYAPERLGGHTGSPASENTTILFVAAVIAYVQAFVYVWNLGYQLDPKVVSVPVLTAAGLLVVYAYRRDAAAT